MISPSTPNIEWKIRKVVEKWPVHVRLAQHKTLTSSFKNNSNWGTLLVGIGSCYQNVSPARPQPPDPRQPSKYQ